MLRERRVYKCVLMMPSLKNNIYEIFEVPTATVYSYMDMYVCVRGGEVKSHSSVNRL